MNYGRIRFWCEIALSAISVALAALFIAEVGDIYYSAKGADVIYTRAIVWEKLKILIGPLVVWVCGVIACFVLSVLFPTAEKKKGADDIERLSRLRKRIPDGRTKEFEAERKIYGNYEIGRYVMYGISTAISVAVAIYTIVYLANGDNFRSGEITADVLVMARRVFPWIVCAVLFFVGTAVYETVTAKTELKTVAKMLVLGKGSPVKVSPLDAKLSSAKEALAAREKEVILTIRIVVTIVACVFIGVGISNGGAKDVLYKAINICTECIGLG